MNLQDQYKKKKVGFGESNNRRILAAEQQKKTRKSARYTTYREKRQITPIKSQPKPEPQHESRLTKLLKWKAEKEKKIQLEKQMKAHCKPLFKVYHVDENILKEVTTAINNVKQIKKNCYNYVRSKINSGRVTRSANKKGNETALDPKTQTHELAPANYNFKAPKNIKQIKSNNSASVSKPKTERSTKTNDLTNRRVTRSQVSKGTQNAIEKDKVVKKKSANNAGNVCNIEDAFPVKNIEMRDRSFFLQTSTTVFGSARTENVCSPVHVHNESGVVLSPFVTVARGKKNARNESKLRLSQAFLLHENSIHQEECAVDEFDVEKQKAHDYETTLNSEITRLLSVCEIWQRIVDSTEFPTDSNTKDEIDATIGQTKLLISKKFEQFRNLIHNCINGDGDRPIHVSDLQGFWDMVYMQVENLDVRFKMLEELKNNDWIEIKQETKQVKKKNGAVIKNKSTTAGPSVGIKAMLRAARNKIKKQMESNPPDENKENSIGVSSSTMTEPVNNVTYKFPIFSPVPSKPNLLHAVLSTEARKRLSKRVSSPGFAMMKASNIAKSVEKNSMNVSVCTPLLNQTPNKSILKTPANESKSARRRTMKAVLFESERTNSPDLICWNTPEIKVRRRSTRLSKKFENLLD